MVSYNPKNLGEALVLLNRHRGATVFAGGTDLMVTRKFSPVVVFVNGLEELRRVGYENSCLKLGAGLTYSELIRMEIPQIMKDVFSQVASPAIRNRGTIGGNICNASPAGDTLPMWYALEAEVELASADDRGIITRRTVPVKEFIHGVRKTDRKENELLTAVLIPAENLSKDNFFCFEKVGARRSEAISKLSFFGTARVEDGKIVRAEAAFGAVGTTVVSADDPERLWKGLTKEELREKREEITEEYMRGVKPIDDQRSTAAYRREAAENLFRNFEKQVENLL